MMPCIGVIDMLQISGKDTVMQLGICWDLGQAETLRLAGADFVECNVQNWLIPTKPDEEFKGRAELTVKSPLPVEAANCFYPASHKVTGLDVNIPELLRYARTAFARAQACGIRLIIFGSGGARAIPDGFSRARAEAQFTELLRQLGPLALERDVTVAIEPLNRKECNFINSLAEGAELINSAGHPRVRLLADFYHMALEDESPDELGRFADLLAHTHTAEKEGRRAPGNHGDNFRPYLRQLLSHSYQGGLSIESSWQDFTTEAPAAIMELKKQLASL